jgi:hypothetical protein
MVDGLLQDGRSIGAAPDMRGHDHLGCGSPFSIRHDDFGSELELDHSVIYPVGNDAIEVHEWSMLRGQRSHANPRRPARLIVLAMMVSLSIPNKTNLGFLHSIRTARHAADVPTLLN